MRRCCLFLLLAVAACANAGCTITGGGDELPTAAQMADAEYGKDADGFRLRRVADEPRR